MFSILCSTPIWGERGRGDIEIVDRYVEGGNPRARSLRNGGLDCSRLTSSPCFGSLYERQASLIHIDQIQYAERTDLDLCREFWVDALPIFRARHIGPIAINLFGPHSLFQAVVGLACSCTQASTSSSVWLDRITRRNASASNPVKARNRPSSVNSVPRTLAA